MKSIQLSHGELRFPAFFPDGTYGGVKAAGADDLREAGVDGIVMNAYHLHRKPGQNAIRRHGGIHAFSGWDGPVLTDSGGFQVYSLIRENPDYGQILKDKIIFRPDMGNEKLIFTPEKCIQIQFAVKSDIIVCLDYCTAPDDPPEEQEKSVETTIRWAAACKREYEKLASGGNRPLLFAVIQGGSSRELRSRCARELIKMGFDGYGYGGWPLDARGGLVLDMLRYTAELMPENAVKYAMGLGRPEEIAVLAGMGYDLFDCVIPTREARHNRLYAFMKAPNEADLTDKSFYRHIYILDDKYAVDITPVSKFCDCLLCRRHSKSYLRHLFKTNDPLAYRLATMHNLRFYSMLTSQLRKNLYGYR
ncbi:MAG: tRNA guanosine(34) transglycosylase Tgt [Defluviitaleaceae bacterium]|nr:tRNA guanosine(34) transglycosylase Tgt [Defluviitaleaceae bacterium]MCL2835593.1 tRNA guanosine(34) transglycosylase Tgt [Defluviitaleaceae bacterium]